MCLKTDQGFVETKNLAAHRSRMVQGYTVSYNPSIWDICWVGPYYHPGPLCICHLEGRFTRPLGTRSNPWIIIFNLSSMACRNGTVKDLGIAGLRLLYTCLPLSLMAGKQAADRGIQMKLLIFRLQSKSTRGPHKTHFEKYKRRYYYYSQDIYKIYTRYHKISHDIDGQREQAFQRSGCQFPPTFRADITDHAS